MNTLYNSFRVSFIKISTILLLVVFVGNSCVDNVGDNYTTFTGDMIYSSLKKSPETYSEFIKVIDKAGLKGLLSAYGDYSCFAPTNEAMKSYYKTFSDKFSFDSLSAIQVDYLAKTHIIPLKYLTSGLVTGAIPTPNMNQRYIVINFITDSLGKFQIILNSESRIITKDVEVYNGCIQTLDKVLQPSNAQIPELLAANPKISIFYKALMLTHLSDSLRLVEDKSYIPINSFVNHYGSGNAPSPKYRKYGYTILIESDDVFSTNGINSLEDLKVKAAELYPSGTGYENDFTNRNNSLNQFISYHLINKTINYNNFVYSYNSVPNVTHYEFIETMYPNTIMRVNDGVTGLKINQDLARNINGVSILPIAAGSKDQSAMNGIYHLIDNLLICNEDVITMLLNTRIRFDLSSLLPELANNGIRGLSYSEFCFPLGYFKNLTFTKETRFYYLGANTSWENYQGDEMQAQGSYDITMRLPPVPAGTYELRYGYTANSRRGVAQIYIDNVPVGIPLDLRIEANNPKIGWMLDLVTTDNGIENEKMMRNRGYLKGPDSHQMIYGGATVVSRDNQQSLRRIIGTFTFERAEAHTIRFKSVLEDPSAQFHMDFMEYVPKNIYAGANIEDRH